jgi:hypothetical protein
MSLIPQLPPVPTTCLTIGDITPAMRIWMNQLLLAVINGPGAPVDATYVTVDDESADLPDSRQIAAGTNITIIDGGAGGPITISAAGGSGADTITATASEDIAIGQFVAVFDSSGTPKCRVAKSSSGQGFQADGFCKAAFASGATATIYLPGSVNVAGGTGLTAGDVWLGTGGYATNTAPTTAGYISQQIGVAEDATKVAFEPQPDVLIATGTSATYGGTSQSQEFLASGTFVVPFGVTGVEVMLIGAGGGGAGKGNSSASSGGGGGGGGEALINMPWKVTSGASIAVVIGAKGTGGSSSASNFTAGVDSGGTSFDTVLIARGGKGGTTTGTSGAGGGSNGSGSKGTNVAGSTGTSESACHFGGSSGGGGGTAAGSNGGAGGGSGPYSSSGGGAGASSIFGVGGAGGASATGGTSSGSTSYGAGGGGAGGVASAVAAAGGDGTAGYCLVSWIS